ncbi:nuclear transport factor 2 family protein [Nocardioides sp. JQ2195]|uniref:nuclear transport factor 2 family protein n=1 Tax=Nocardioides sp. JQ2195 TaxID=2592334 RepID=UPI00143E4ED6|nr:nuclear transport factor 2 family protein [Nocardioides sp. JQ2195]QIX26506.1 nuclear transport factor 2 family protein [Nocardioides sp. JQ2195]
MANVLEDIKAIEQLKYRYFRAGDTRNWGLLEATLDPDIRASYGNGLEFDSAAELVETVRKAMDNSRLTVHFAHHPEIDVDGDEASGTWLLRFRSVQKANRQLVEGAGIYTDEYRRGADGTWRISRTMLERLYEFQTSFDDTPSFELTADHLAD